MKKIGIFFWVPMVRLDPIEQILEFVPMENFVPFIPNGTICSKGNIRSNRTNSNICSNNPVGCNKF